MVLDIYLYIDFNYTTELFFVCHCPGGAQSVRAREAVLAALAALTSFNTVSATAK